MKLVEAVIRGMGVLSVSLPLVGCARIDPDLNAQEIQRACEDVSKTKTNYPRVWADYFGKPPNTVILRIVVQTDDSQKSIISDDNELDENYPSLSSDNKTIVFVVNGKPRPGPITIPPQVVVPTQEDGIWTMDINGENKKKITSQPPGSQFSDPSFSPDGGQIVFVSSQKEANNQSLDNIILTDTSGKNVTQITHFKQLDPSTPLSAPKFSPSGKIIAFQSAVGILATDVKGEVNVECK